LHDSRPGRRVATVEAVAEQVVDSCPTLIPEQISPSSISTTLPGGTFHGG